MTQTPGSEPHAFARQPARSFLAPALVVIVFALGLSSLAACTRNGPVDATDATEDRDDDGPPKQAVDTSPDSATPDHGAARADGAACESATDCASGICEGQGCGLEEGRCMPTARACTRDLRSFCTCDGRTIQASSRCPGERFAHLGPCREGAGVDTSPEGVDGGVPEVTRKRRPG